MFPCFPFHFLPACRLLLFWRIKLPVSHTPRALNVARIVPAWCGCRISQTSSPSLSLFIPHSSLHLPLLNVCSFWPELLLLLSALVFIPATYTASQAASPCRTLSASLPVKFSSDWFCVAAFACFLARRRRRQRQQRNGGVFFRVAAAEWVRGGRGSSGRRCRRLSWEFMCHVRFIFLRCYVD